MEFLSLSEAIDALRAGRRAGRARGLYASDSVRGRTRADPPGPPRPAPGAHDAGPDLRPADRHGLRARAHVFLGRQSRRRLAASPARRGGARLAATARARRAHARRHGRRLLRGCCAPAVRSVARLHRHRPRRAQSAHLGACAAPILARRHRDRARAQSRRHDPARAARRRARATSRSTASSARSARRRSPPAASWSRSRKSSTRCRRR